MPMLTIEIANEGVWNAVTCETLGTQYLVLENFRVHPFQDGIVKMRKETVDPAVMHLQEGTPVVVDGDEGVVIVPDAHMPMIGFDADEVRIVPMDTISYRMNTTIDKLHEVSSHIMKTFRGVPYLVPTATSPKRVPAAPSPATVTPDVSSLVSTVPPPATATPDVSSTTFVSTCIQPYPKLVLRGVATSTATHVSDVSSTTFVSKCIRHWPKFILDRAVEFTHMSEGDALRSFRSDRARSGFSFVLTDNRKMMDKIYYACIDPVPDHRRDVARPCFRGKFHSTPTDAAREVVSFLVTLGNAIETQDNNNTMQNDADTVQAAREVVSPMVTLGNALDYTVHETPGAKHPQVGDAVTTVVDGVSHDHIVVKAPAPSVHPQKADKAQLVVTVQCPDCDGLIEFNAHQLGDSRADNTYRSARIKDHERRNHAQVGDAVTTVVDGVLQNARMDVYAKRARTLVSSYSEDEEHVRVKKMYRFADPDIHPDLKMHLAPHLDKLRYNRMIEEDGQSAYKGVHAWGHRYKVSVWNGTKSIYLGTYDSTTVAAIAVCAWRLDSTLASCDAVKEWFHTMQNDRDARRAWVESYVPRSVSSVHEIE